MSEHQQGVQEQWNRMVEQMFEDTIAQLGCPTRDDVDEVAERLVELERRQHGIEKKLDRIVE